MPADLETLKAELLELDRQLHLATLLTGDRGETAQSEPLAVLKQRLDDRLATLDGSAWQLVLLEWRYDFALLFDHIRLWMARVDAGFTLDSSPKV